jgi:hypothetical protein
LWQRCEWFIGCQSRPLERYLEDAEELADALDALQDGEAPIPLARVKAELGF